MSGLCAFICYYMVKDDCINMSQYCVLLFGFMSVLNCILEVINLAGNLGGRSERTENGGPDPSQLATGQATTYTVTIKTTVHPFFDPTGGFVYNAQSATMIACPVMSLLGALLSKLTYGSYTTSLFSDQGEAGAAGSFGTYGNGYGGAGNAGGGGSMYGGGFSGASGTSAGSGFGGASGTPGGGRPLGRPAASGPKLFEGSGQRLGNG